MASRKSVSRKASLVRWFKKATANHMKRVQHGPPRLTLMEWMSIVETFNGHCGYCNQKPEGDLLWIEHMNPVSNGGEHRKHNVIPACQRCNQRKGNKTLLEYVRKGMFDE